MATWKTAAELSAKYLVGGERLSEYSRRGNLPSLRLPDGTALFDEDIVARFFRARNAAYAPMAPAQNLGVLGEARLGTPEPAPAPSAREERRRAPRAAPKSRALLQTFCIE
ncbi:MAG TPA: hypothetical protein VKY73_15935 [Polyangiaceae bacterium]|nr:hypothetical protein [Polyangiaceae bacterium]